MMLPSNLEPSSNPRLGKAGESGVPLRRSKFICRWEILYSPALERRGFGGGPEFVSGYASLYICSFFAYFAYFAVPISPYFAVLSAAMSSLEFPACLRRVAGYSGSVRSVYFASLASSKPPCNPA